MSDIFNESAEGYIMEQEIIEPSTALAIVEIKSPSLVFVQKGLDPFIVRIKEDAEKKAAALDISTEKGRTAIKSLAYDIAKAKNKLDKIGETLTVEQREQINAVNAERRRAWDELEALQEKIRKPVTDWEDADKKRVADHEAALNLIMAARLSPANTSAEFKSHLESLPELINRDWQEFSARAILEVDATRAFLDEKIKSAEKAEAEAAELARLREQEAARIKKEHEEKIAADAAAAAKTAAEEKAAADALAAQKKADREKEEIAERERKAVDALRAAEDKRVADLKRAEEEKQEALRKQAADAAAAAKAEEDAAKKREADTEHKKKINNEALDAIVIAATLTADQAKLVVQTIAQGKIPHVSIKY